MKSFISKVQNDTPGAWDDFEEFYKENYKIGIAEFLAFPFEMQLGVYLKFLIENTVEIDICNPEFSSLPDVVADAFAVHERVRGHFS